MEFIPLTESSSLSCVPECKVFAILQDAFALYKDRTMKQLGGSVSLSSPSLSYSFNKSWL